MCITVPSVGYKCTDLRHSVPSRRVQSLFVFPRSSSWKLVFDYARTAGVFQDNYAAVRRNYFDKLLTKLPHSILNRVATPRRQIYAPGGAEGASPTFQGSLCEECSR